MFAKYTPTYRLGCILCRYDIIINMTRIEKIAFYLFIFLLPFQIGKLVYTFPILPESFYHQIFIYLSDILICLLLLLWGLRLFRSVRERQDFYRAFKADFVLVLFILFSGVSIFVASDGYLSAFHFFKLLEFVLLYFYTRQNFKYIDIGKLVCVVIVSALVQVFVADTQFHFQGDVGLKYLGESPLSPTIDGVAKINEDGFKLMRSYGTFPHPNILAVFLVLALFLTYFAVLKNASRIGQNKAIYVIGQAKYAITVGLLFLLSLGLMLTFSRSTIAIFLASSIIFFSTLIFSKAIITEKIKVFKIFIITIFIFISLGFVFRNEIIFRASSILSDQSLSQRFFYNEVALNQISSSPIFGVGIGNFIVDFYTRYNNIAVWQYQPAHNLFLLVAAEIGILGALLLITFIIQNLYRLIRNKLNSGDVFTISILIIFLNYLVLANFDHYFWTIQQGQILFWVAFGILNSCRPKVGIDK